MTLLILAYLGGVVTIISPCILPVLPFVFARADRPFMTSGLPMLIGMALTFAAVASLAAVAGGWAVEANQFGRDAAIALLGLFGLTLIFPSFADRAMQPLVNLGARLSNAAGNADATNKASILPSFLLGIATGFLWAPCAGPILGLILTGAALKGANAGTTALLLAYALGAATSLALALAIGGRVFAAMKRSLGVGEWVRQGLGIAVLVAVVAIFLGADTGFLTHVSQSLTNNFEQSLVDRLKPPLKSAGNTAPQSAGADMNLPVEDGFPPLDGAAAWLNSPPLTREGLKGKVVVVDFWTYSCINCLRSIPYVRAWAEKYKDQGLVVIGVHTPEFAFERDVKNVQAAVESLKIGYPVAIDNDYTIWRAFDNEYWPAHYFIDAQGRIRYHHFGEGDYDQSERVIQRLLADAGNKSVSQNLVAVDASGVEAAASANDDKSPETYIGYNRADNFVSPGGLLPDEKKTYDPADLKINQWDPSGDWTVGPESGTLDTTDGSITYRFHARDLHLVLAPGKDGKPVRFVITVDGQPPMGDHGGDTDTEGKGTVTEQRLYQLIRQSSAVGDHTFKIQFLDPGVRAYAFTFG
ncbi:MAG TPA: cytochrome c biogenesis protein DipZ [Xanthobacteraceae bacterium]|jgi:cytochrome c biogenesis protein CcdA/thiol-disulfide isomerase/thioredoxin|nr:cytochrome c biogenesis protein DipZ [Xanthobacteraceae bacterium]